MQETTCLPLPFSVHLYQLYLHTIIDFYTQDSDVQNKEEDYVPSIAIVGRPNVGKSSILNALVGEDRTIVSPVSGTTRDAIDTEFEGPDGQVCFGLIVNRLTVGLSD